LGDCGKMAAMPRIARIAPGGMLFHVLNRGVGKMRIFRSADDYEAFGRVVEETLVLAPMRICAFCWMPNHWHFVLWPEHKGDLSAFVQRMTNTHTQRWQRAKRRVGFGHLYQGRFKSFPIENDEHFYRVVRYVERNALRAGLVRRAEDWQWGSLFQRRRPLGRALLAEWPLPRSSGWTKLVNAPGTEAEVSAIQTCVHRGSPYGDATWTDRTAQRLGLQSTLRPRGRPRKEA
jgi:putative transposase